MVFKCQICMNAGFMKRFFISLAIAAAAVFSPNLGAAAPQSASDAAQNWMRGCKLQRGLDRKTGRVTETESSEFDIPRLAPKTWSLKCRDEAFDEAFRGVLATQLSNLRSRINTDETSNVGGKESAGRAVSFGEVFAKEFALFKSAPDGDFVHKTISVTDDRGEVVDIVRAGKINIATSAASSTDGSIKGLGVVKSFESFDSDERVYEVSVVASYNPSTAIDILHAMEMGQQLSSRPGKKSFEGWLETCAFKDLLGVVQYVDGDGKLCVAGIAYSDNPDDTAARRMARMRAAFAFGADIKTSKRIVETIDHKTYYCRVAVFDATESVTGSSYPDDMIEYKVVKKNSHLFGGDVYAILCILRSGAKEFRERKFENKLRDEVGAKFYEGKRQSLIELRTAIEKKMNTLGNSDQDKHRRKGLKDVLDKLDAQIKELDEQFNFSPR